MIHFLYRNEILVGLEGLQKIKTQTSTFSSSFWVLCIHVLKISVLLLRELPIWLYKMCFFSFRQTLHFLVVGLNILPLSIRFHLISYCLFSFFNCQIWLARVVLFLFFSCSKVVLCPSHLFLNVPPVTPVYVSVFPFPDSVTVAL